MSKKSKGSSGKKKDKKNKGTKPVKNSASKKGAKKAPKSAKKPAPKKPAKKVVAKKPKPAQKPAKKAAPKKPVKKTAKPELKKAVVKAPQKVAAKKEVKAAKTPVASKPEIKSLPKKEVVSPKVEKPVEKTSAKSESKAEPSKVLAITNTIPKAEVKAISANKIASISSSITNPIKKNDSYSIKPEKEPNGKFELELVVRSSPEMLFEFLSTPSGLSEWFCDDVNIRNGIYTFIWDGQLQQARLLKTVDDQLVRFQWVDKTDGSYFEFRIQKDDLTNDISLIITDFAETVSERESSKRLWQSQVEKLMHIIGSIF
ncbi:MAG: hypothetical protein K0S32_1063 [Bacteroidetes bacterium]|jgi:uncharacterized protein YndB with AHSA1/START domain|nr:hypothetical protein [Bacteroidota bacterium]